MPMWGSNAQKVNYSKEKKRTESETMWRNFCGTKSQEALQSLLQSTLLVLWHSKAASGWVTNMRLKSMLCKSCCILVGLKFAAPHVSLRVYKMKTPMLREPGHSNKYNALATHSKELGPSTTSTNMVNFHKPSFFIILPSWKKGL